MPTNFCKKRKKREGKDILKQGKENQTVIVLQARRQPNVSPPCTLRVLCRSRQDFKNKKHHGNFAVSEDTHALRLESKLSDLQAGYANPCVCKHTLYDFDE